LLTVITSSYRGQTTTIAQDGAGPLLPSCAVDADTPALPSMTRKEAASACQMGTGAALPILTLDQAKQEVARVWILCSPLGLFRHPQAGVEVRATGDLAFLAWDEDDRLRRQRGMENEGHWTAIDTSAMNGRPLFQITYEHLGFVYSFLRVTDTGMLLIDNNGVEQYQYVTPAEHH